MTKRSIRIISYNGTRYVGKITDDGDYTYVFHPMVILPDGNLKPEPVCQVIFESAFVKYNGQPNPDMLHHYHNLVPRYFSELLRRA